MLYILLFFKPFNCWDEVNSWVRYFRGVVANVLDRDTVVSEIELQLRYYIHFWTNTQGKGVNSLIFLGYW